MNTLGTADISYSSDEPALSSGIKYVYLFLVPISLVGSSIIITTYLRFNDLKKPGANFVFFQSICDFIFSFKFMLTAILSYVPSFNQYNENLNNTFACGFIGSMGQSMGLASTGWNFMMSVVVALTVYQADNMKKERKLRKIHCHLFVWSSTIILTLIPVRDYGPTNIGCWIKGSKNLMRLTFLIPYSFYMIGSICVLFYVLYKVKFSKSFRGSHYTESTEKTRFIGQLSKYVIIFVVFWFPVLLLRSLELAGQEKSTFHLAALYMDAIGCSLQGAANATVWVTSPQFVRLVKQRLAKSIPDEYNLILATAQNSLNNSGRASRSV